MFAQAYIIDRAVCLFVRFIFFVLDPNLCLHGKLPLTLHVSALQDHPPQWGDSCLCSQSTARLLWAESSHEYTILFMLCCNCSHLSPNSSCASVIFLYVPWGQDYIYFNLLDTITIPYSNKVPNKSLCMNKILQIFFPAIGLMHPLRKSFNSRA